MNGVVGAMWLRAVQVPCVVGYVFGTQQTQKGFSLALSAPHSHGKLRTGKYDGTTQHSVRGHHSTRRVRGTGVCAAGDCSARTSRVLRDRREHDGHLTRLPVDGVPRRRKRHRRQGVPCVPPARPRFPLDSALTFSLSSRIPHTVGTKSPRTLFREPSSCVLASS